MSSAFDICREAGIRLKSYSTGEHRSVCPWCSHLRKAINRKVECLATRIDGAGVQWYCHHCGEAGGKFYTQSTEQVRTRGRYPYSAKSNRSLYR